MTITNLETSKTIKLGYNAKRNKILEDIVVKTPKRDPGMENRSKQSRGKTL